MKFVAVLKAIYDFITRTKQRRVSNYDPSAWRAGGQPIDRTKNFLCSIGKHDWEIIKTVQEVTYEKGEIRICRRCNKSQKREEKRSFTEWK